jgi:predicted RNase H-like nuclease (RuvC/YqgF family)
LEGKLVLSTHKTFAGMAWFIEQIRRAGTPSIIACDKEPGSMPRKLSAIFDVPISYPKTEISVSDKMRAAEPFGIRNPHERDACAAAVKAYNSHANKINQAARIAREMKLQNIDEICSKVMAHYSINEAITGKTANRP